MKDANRTRRKQIRGYADGGPVMTAGPNRTEAERDKALADYAKRPPPNRSIDVDRQPPRLAGEGKAGFLDRLVGRLRPKPETDQSIEIKPPVNATNDSIWYDPPKSKDFAKGGPIKKVSGRPRGKEDGTIAVQRGEYVVRRASVKKYGAKKMAAVNKGTAKVTAPRKR